jgi:seryl-tRNA synthetase
MKMLEFRVSNKVNIKEMEKKLSFVSEDIIRYNISEYRLTIYYKDGIDINEIKQKVNRLMQTSEMGIVEGKSNEFIISEEDSEETYFSNIIDRIYVDTAEIMSGQYVKICGEGMISLSGRAVELFEYFDKTFKEFAKELGAVEERYPVLLSNKTIQDTGYLKTSPQYIHCVNTVKEDMDILMSLGKKGNIEKCERDILGSRQEVLSPSACFHVYENYRGKVLKEYTAVTLLQSVFRNEGRFNWREYGRLRDYHVREIVFIGSEDYVKESLIKLMDKTKKFIQRMGLSGEIKTASDPFVIPNMQRFKKLQLKNKVKYEARLNYSKEQQMSAASFNFHGKTFTYPFNIKVEMEEDTVTGCVGYGIERWVLAYLSQYEKINSYNTNFDS